MSDFKFGFKKKLQSCESLRICRKSLGEFQYSVEGTYYQRYLYTG